MKFKEIESLLNKNNGILTIKEAEENGIYRGSIKYFTEKGKLEKVSRGVYVSPGIFEDEFFVVQNRFKKGIYSLETALYLHDLTDRTPSVFNMIFPKGYNLTNPKKNGIKCKSIKEDLYELGKEEIKTPNGYNVYAYNIERTLMNTDIEYFKDFSEYTNKGLPNGIYRIGFVSKINFEKYYIMKEFEIK